MSFGVFPYSCLLCLLQVLFSKFVGDANVGQATLFLTCLGNGDDVAAVSSVKLVMNMMKMMSMMSVVRKNISSADKSDDKCKSESVNLCFEPSQSRTFISVLKLSLIHI